MIQQKGKVHAFFFIAVIIVASAIVGLGVTHILYKNKANLTQWFSAKPLLYQTPYSELQKRFDKLEESDVTRVEWGELLPDNERTVLQKFQQKEANTAKDFADNILLSLEASTNVEYNAAMVSVNTVSDFDDMPISIAGYIVPIDYHEDRSLSDMFIVPYFGACIHFPPPPPNQIIFSQLEQGFLEFDITQAYQLTGILRRGLFEDSLGTSAYILEVHSIAPYFKEPDSFRQH